MLQDITEHRKSQEDLKKRESELRAFSDNIEGAASLIDTNKRYLIFNQRFIQDHMLLSSHAPYAGEEIYDFLPDTVKEERHQLLNRVLEGKKEVIDVNYMRNGRRIYYRTSFIPVIADGKVIGISTYSLDLTDIREAEIAIREAEMKFRDLVEKSPVSVYIFQGGKFAYVNPTMCLESGYTEEELLNLPLERFVHPDDLAAVNNRIELRLKGNPDETRHEIIAYRKSGEITWLEIYGTATVYMGAPAIIGTMVNVTERKRMELEREKIVADLLQRNRDLEQFSYIVSHNIRGPVATLLGLGNLLQSEITADDKRKALSGMLNESMKLDLVVRDVSSILNVKKNLIQSKVKINLNDIVRRVLSDLQSIINSSGATIRSDFSQADHVNSLEVYLHSIFLNLVSNGIRYSQPGKKPDIRIWTEKYNGSIKIFFKDNGMGFDLEKHGDQVFGLYKRFNLNIEGKGIGLFMVKTQVGALNGTIELQSKPMEGSTFIVSLPEM